MLKAILLATTMIAAAPAFAQDQKATQATPASEASTTADQTAPAADATPATDAATQGDTTAAATPQAAPTTGDAPAQPAQQAATTPAQQPATSQEQVAQAVSRDWSTYDKDGNAQLSAPEFAAWMTTLRKASEPNFETGTAAANSWAVQAFTAADTDKSVSVSRQELTTFLTPKPS